MSHAAGPKWATLTAVLALGMFGTAMDRCRHGQNGDPKAPPVLVGIYLNAYPLNIQISTSFQMVATGSYSNGALVANEPVTWSMPANPYATCSASGYVTATATAGSTTVTATSVADPMISRTGTVNVSLGPPPAPVFASATALPDAMVSPSTYTYHLSVTGGQSPLTFQHIGGEFPIGITLATDGTISGSCTVVGDYNVRLTVTDNLNRTDTKDFTLKVVAYHT